MFSMKTCPSRHPVEVQIESTSWKGVWWCDGGRYWEQIWLRVWEWVIEAGSFSIREPPWQLSLHGHTKAMPTTCLNSPVDLVKEFPFNSWTKYWIILNLPKNDERGHLLKNLSWDYHHGGSTALVLPYDLVTTHWHSMMFPIFLQIPSSMIMISGCERTEAQQRLLCGVGKKNYNLQPFCFLLPLMRISLANNRFIFSNNSSACQRQ